MSENTSKNSGLFYVLMTLAALLIILLPVGIANLYFGYVLLDSPCTLCWGQRIAMMFIGAMAFMIVRYGFKPRFAGSILVFAGFGLWQSFRHFAMHAGRDLDQGFGLAVFGIHTPFWAEIVFWAVVVLLGVMFFFAPRCGFESAENGSRKWFDLSAFGKVAVGVSTAIVASNLVQALVSTGLPPNYGQGDPVRFSWKADEIIHTPSGMKHNWNKVSFLGKRDVKAPDYAFAHNAQALGIKFATDPAMAPVALTRSVSIVSTRDIPVSKPLNTLTMIGGEYVVSSKFDVWYLNKDLKTVSSMEIDPLYSATIDPIVGVIPVKGSKYLLMGSNKTILRFEKSATKNPARQIVGRYSDFVRGGSQFLAANRGRVETQRAKFHHVMSLASDGKYAYETTVPNNLDKKKFVVVKELIADMVTSGEFTPAAPTLKKGRTLGELYVTGLAFYNGKLYASSKNYNVILEIDPAREEVTQVIGMPKDLKDVRGLIADASGFQVISGNRLVTLK